MAAAAAAAAAGAAEATTANPMLAAAAQAKGSEAAPAKSKPADPDAEHLDHHGHLNDLWVIARRYPPACCWARTWARLNPHRKIDTIFGIIISFSFTLTSCYVLLA
jgi:hypothetical protein